MPKPFSYNIFKLYPKNYGNKFSILKTQFRALCSE